MRLRRVAVWMLALALLGLAVFAVPTLWLRPWSIDHFYHRVFAELLLAHPMLLSTLRVIEPWGLRFHEDDLDDFSPTFALVERERVERNLQTLRSYDRSGMDPEARLSAEVLDWFLDDRVRGGRFLFHDYPLNAFQGLQGTLPDFMLNVHPLDDAEGAGNYVKRLVAMGPALDQVAEGVRFRAARGVIPPRFVVEAVQEEVADLLATPPERHPLATHLEEHSRAIPDLDAERRADLLDDADAALREVVYPAYERIGALLEELAPRAGDEAGVWSLPDGEAYYAWALRHHTTTELSPDAVHALGLREVERISGEIRALLDAEGLPVEPLGASLAALHAEERFRFPDSDAGREQILETFRAIIADARPRLPDLFGRLPRAEVRVERVPEFKEAGSARAYYFPPALDGSRPGVFYANLRSVDEHVRFGMRTLAYHEAIPGHHLQIALAMELEGVPLFRRVIPFTAFIEGWALYAEQLAAEQGLLPTNFDRIGQLVAELWRAVRLVVDTGIHAKRWSRERAIDYMAGLTGMPSSDVVAEVERYIVTPGQACAYKVGQLEILRLRERARERLGAAFDLRDFHDVVLGQGSLPLALLDPVVAEALP